MASTVGIAVLFTDLVGSTALASELGPDEAERLRVVHFGLLREPVTEHGGHEVKNLGDGIMATFPGARAALDAAVAMQCAIHRHNATNASTPISIRVGVATGDCTEDGGDYFGEPVVQAARLCAAAEGGEILATGVFRMLVPRDAHELEDVGELDLKGLPDPVPSLRVGWTPDDRPSVPLPARLATEHGTPLVGRSHERRLLDDCLKSAVAGRRTIALVTGEAGQGKTRLTSAFAADASSGGALVLYGRCDEDLAVPYLPWIECLSHFVEHADDHDLGEIDDATVAHLAGLLPGLTERRAISEDSVGALGDQYALVAAVTRLLTSIASRWPTVVVLDDLHWADAGTMLLVRHLATSVVDARLLVVGTYRETDLGPDDPLTEVSASLHRVDDVQRVPLQGLSDDEVVTLVQAIAGHDLDDDGVALAHTVRTDAAGNPFFVVELLRHLAEGGAIVQADDGRWTLAHGVDAIALPQSVRDVVGQRVRRLGPDAHATLTAAAVQGREFDAEVVAAALGVDDDDVLGRLEESMTAGLVAEVPDVPDRFSFTHALVQHTLYEELSATRRARMHRRVAEAIEGLVGDEPGVRVGELAKHWFAAVRPSELDRAIDYAMRAGRRALDTAAPSEAVRWFTQALEALADGDRELRCEVLAALGEAERRVGRDSYRERLLQAARIAESVERDDVLVAAAISNYRGLYSMTGEVDRERVAVLESALARVEHHDQASRARLLATLAGELTYSDDVRRAALAREASEIARAVGDDEVLIDALERTGGALNVPELIDERDERTAEAMALTERSNDPVRRFFALDRRAQVLLERADMTGARACSHERARIADQLGEPLLQWLAVFGEAALDLAAGDVDGATSKGEQALALGLETGQPDALVFYGGQLVQIDWHRGVWDEGIALIEQGLERAPGISAFPPVHATFLFRAGREHDARAAVDAMAATGFDIPHDLLWLTSTCLAAEAVHLVDDVDSAGLLLERLLPFREHIAVSRGTFQGAASFYAGLLAVTAGNDDAESLLRDAVDRNGRVQTPFHRARAQLALATHVRDRRPDEADELVTAVKASIERHAIDGLREQVAASER